MGQVGFVRRSEAPATAVAVAERANTPDLDRAAVERMVEEMVEAKLKARKEPVFTPEEQAEFDPAWKAFPRHVGKPAAKRAWRAARKKVELGPLMDAIRAYAALRDGEGHKYTCHMSTWLNQERWRDPDAGAPPRRVKLSLPVNGVTASVRYVLEREVFVGQSDPPRRARHFIRTIMAKAREMSIRQDGGDAALARHLASFQAAIGDEIHRTRRSDEGAQGSGELLWQFMDWASRQDWPDLTLAVFDLKSRAFDRWRAEAARGDPLGRDPLSGRTRGSR